MSKWIKLNVIDTPFTIWDMVAPEDFNRRAQQWIEYRTRELLEQNPEALTEEEQRFIEDANRFSSGIQFPHSEKPDLPQE